MLSAENKERIKKATHDTLAKGNQIFGTSAVINRVVFQSNTTTKYGSAGWDNSADGYIVFYVKYSAEYSEHDPEFIIKTIVPHEVAHIIAFWLKLNHKKYGDYEHAAGWQHICNALGGDPAQKSDTDKPMDEKSRYEWATTGGNTVYLSQKEHDMITKDFMVMKDKHGNRITKFIRQVK